MSTLKQAICKVIYDEYGSPEAAETASEMYDLIEEGAGKTSVLARVQAHHNCGFDEEPECKFSFEEIYDRIITEIEKMKSLYSGRP